MDYRLSLMSMSIKVDDGGSYYCSDMGNLTERITLITAQESGLFVISFHTSANNAHLYYLHCIYRT
jgi:hypothetical protein